MNVSVIIPTYKRPDSLGKCLTGLCEQNHRADEVIVVTRDNDVESRDVAMQFSTSFIILKMCIVDQAGVIAAMNLGLADATGDLVALIDDDAIPAKDWLRRIVSSFRSDSMIAGVGGKDNVFIGGNPERGMSRIVGKLSWFGRIEGGHHLGFGTAREVDVLKGVNCAFRRKQLAQFGFDTRMRGVGAQVHWELSLCLAIRRAGWKLVYDPTITVDHYPAPRHDNDQRSGFDHLAYQNAVHNETLALMDHLGRFRRWIFLIWAASVGSKGALGIVQAIRLKASGEKFVWARCKASFLGRTAGIRSACGWTPHRS